MAYTKPTAAEVKERFPCFNAVSNGLIDALIDEAPVDTSWREKDYAPAIKYWVAHKLTIENALGTKPVETSGPITSRTLGDASESYAVAGKADSSVHDYGSTPYGREFQRLLRGNHAGPVVI